MFTPFAFIAAAGQIQPIHNIITGSLSFYIDPIYGFYVSGGVNYIEEQITGYIGGVDATVNIIDDNYYQNISEASKIIFSTGSNSDWYFNSPTKGDFTVEFWAYYTSSFTSSALISTPIAINSNEDTENDSIFGGFDDITSIYTLVPSKEEVFVTGSSILDKWVHVVTTYDYISPTGGTTTTYYQVSDETIIYSGSDGSFIGQGPRPFTGNFVIGGKVAGQDPFARAFINGLIGPVRIYDKVLSLEEIEQNYDAEVGRFS
jgi:hypothetical protein